MIDDLPEGQTQYEGGIGQSASTAGLGVAVTPAPTFNCMECGMPTEANEYHPYAACLMFKCCHDSAVVRANLDAVTAHGARYEFEARQPCDVMEFSSRMCEYGTKGCIRAHTTPNNQSDRLADDKGE